MNVDRNGTFVAKYAPKDLSEVVFSDDKEEMAIQRYVSEGEMRPLILYGTNGTGKSTIARLLSRKMIADSYELNVRDISALSAASYSNLGKHILEDLRTGSLSGSDIKIYILDEFNLFPNAFVRLLKSAIDQSAGHVLFVATTNDINALDKGHRSRAVRLHIVQASLERWMPRIEAILAAEGMPVPDRRVLQSLLDNSQGDNRQFLADLQRVCEGARPSRHHRHGADGHGLATTAQAPSGAG